MQQLKQLHSTNGASTALIHIVSHLNSGSLPFATRTSDGSRTLTGTLAMSVCVYPSNRRSLAANRAPTRGAPLRVGNLHTIPTTPCTFSVALQIEARRAEAE